MHPLLRPLILSALLWPLVAGAAVGALDRISASKTITITYPANAYPIAFKDNDGAPRGYSVDLCRRIVASIQQDLGLDALEIAWLEGNTPRRLAAIATGEADIDCGTTTLTLSRQERVDFSNVVFVESGAILVKSDAGIKDVPELGGKRVGVVPETTTEHRLRAMLAERLINAELVPIRDAKDGREQLVAGRIDAVASDRLVLIGQVMDAEDSANDFSILDADFSVEPYAFALPRNDADFRLAVNRGLARVYRTVEIDRIFERWFGRDSAPSELLEAVFFIYGLAD